MSQLKPKTIKFDEKLLEQVKKKKLNIQEVCRNALEEALKLKVCPTCGQHLKIK